MLIVKNNQSNIICMTLTECLNDVSISGTTTGYTLTLENETTNEVFTGIILVDESQYTQRYNQFTITLTGLTSIDYSLTKIYLKDEGFYTYKVYYTADNLSELIEEGFMKVVGENEVIETISYTTNDDDNYFSYEN